jgi:hypothetical protein
MGCGSSAWIYRIIATFNFIVSQDNFSDSGWNMANHAQDIFHLIIRYRFIG